MCYEHDHPEIFHYNSTRFYVKGVKDKLDEEVWLCIDHFKDYRDYLNSLRKVFKNDPRTRHYYEETLKKMLDKGVDKTHVPGRDLMD